MAASPGNPAGQAPAAPARAPEAIMADAVKATGGQEAWNAHKSLHMKMEMNFRGLGITGVGERFATSANKALVVTTVPGVGTIREGTDGKALWSEDPINGLRLLEGAEAEQARIDSTWNAELRLKELYAKVESVNEIGDDGTQYECLVLTPKLAPPITNCYDAKTHLQVLQKGKRSTPQGDTPFVSRVKDWREVGGVKVAHALETQAGPVTFTGQITEVTFDKALDDKMFAVPSKPTPPAPSAPKKKGQKKKDPAAAKPAPAATPTPAPATK
jgi:hypothetical protein